MFFLIKIVRVRYNRRTSCVYTHTHKNTYYTYTHVCIFMHNCNVVCVRVCVFLHVFERELRAFGKLHKTFKFPSIVHSLNCKHFEFYLLEIYDDSIKYLTWRVSEKWMKHPLKPTLTYFVSILWEMLFYINRSLLYGLFRMKLNTNLLYEVFISEFQWKSGQFEFFLCFFSLYFFQSLHSFEGSSRKNRGGGGYPIGFFIPIR